MLNYIKADLYKALNRAYMYVFLGVMVVLAFSVNLLIRIYSPQMTAGSIMQISIGMLMVPIFLVLMNVDVISGDDVREHTFKNILSYGVPRSKLYVANIMASVILAFIIFSITLMVLLGSAFLFLEPGKIVTAAFLKDYFLRILAAIPLYIAAISFGTLLSIIIKSNNAFGFAYAMIFVAFAPIIKAVASLISYKIMILYNVLITAQITNLTQRAVSNGALFEAALTGIIYTAIFTIIGIIVFNKKEIK